MDHKLNSPIAIHAEPGSFSEEWINLCIKEDIPFKIVNCHESDIIEQLKNCSGLMWHWSHSDIASSNFAKQLMQALASSDFPTFPNVNTAWHFDDKLGQKYLFESLDIPHVPSFTFYSKQNATEFISQKKLPVVFKLRGGAGSVNVQLVKSKKHADQIIKKSFGRGWKKRSRTSYLDQRIWEARRDNTAKSYLNILKGVGRSLFPPKAYRTNQVDSHYTYFQEFADGNDSDIRIVVCGKKAFGFQRMVREGDFRASGSGTINPISGKMSNECIKIAFDAAQRMKTQCVAFDFIYHDGKPVIVEASYGFSSKAVLVNCSGYWDPELIWHNEAPIPEKIMLENFIQEITSKDRS